MFVPAFEVGCSIPFIYVIHLLEKLYKSLIRNVYMPKGRILMVFAVLEAVALTTVL